MSYKYRTAGVGCKAIPIGKRRVKKSSWTKVMEGFVTSGLIQIRGREQSELLFGIAKETSSPQEQSLCEFCYRRCYTKSSRDEVWSLFGKSGGGNRIVIQSDFLEVIYTSLPRVKFDYRPRDTNYVAHTLAKECDLQLNVRFEYPTSLVSHY